MCYFQSWFPVSLVTPTHFSSPVVLNAGWFSPLSPTQGHLQCLEAVLIVSAGRRGLLARRGVAECGAKQTERLRTDPTPSKNDLPSNVNSAGVEKLCCQWHCWGRWVGEWENETGFRNVPLGFTKRLRLGAGKKGKPWGWNLQCAQIFLF